MLRAREPRNSATPACGWPLLCDEPYQAGSPIFAARHRLATTSNTRTVIAESSTRWTCERPAAQSSGKLIGAAGPPRKVGGHLVTHSAHPARRPPRAHGHHGPRAARADPARTIH